MRCIHIGCSGHDESHEALVHGQEAILSAMRDITEKVSHTMTTVDQVAADFAQYKQDVADAFARLQASIAAGTSDSAALDALDAAIKGADADAVAEDATPLDAGDAPASDGTDATPLDAETAPAA